MPGSDLAPALVPGPSPDLALVPGPGSGPDLALVASMQRYYPYVLGSASVGVLKLLGVIPLTMQFASDKACIQHITGGYDNILHAYHTFFRTVWGC